MKKGKLKNVFAGIIAILFGLGMIMGSGYYLSLWAKCDRVEIREIVSNREIRSTNSSRGIPRVVGHVQVLRVGASNRLNLQEDEEITALVRNDRFVDISGDNFQIYSHKFIAPRGIFDSGEMRGYTYDYVEPANAFILFGLLCLGIVLLLAGIGELSGKKTVDSKFFSISLAGSLCSLAIGFLTTHPIIGIVLVIALFIWIKKQKN